MNIVTSNVVFVKKKQKKPYKDANTEVYASRRDILMLVHVRIDLLASQEDTLQDALKRKTLLRK